MERNLIPALTVYRNASFDYEDEKRKEKKHIYYE